jgi:mRNA interferase RelE/StbE
VTEQTVWNIEFLSSSLKALRKMAPRERDLILTFLRNRVAKAEDPRRMGKALTGEMKGLWRYRVGDYRIVCEILDGRVTVLVVRVGPRREVYD